MEVVKVEANIRYFGQPKAKGAFMAERIACPTCKQVVQLELDRRILIEGYIVVEERVYGICGCQQALHPNNPGTRGFLGHQEIPGVTAPACVCGVCDQGMAMTDREEVKGGHIVIGEQVYGSCACQRASITDPGTLFL